MIRFLYLSTGVDEKHMFIIFSQSITPQQIQHRRSSKTTSGLYASQCTVTTSPIHLKEFIRYEDTLTFLASLNTFHVHQYTKYINGKLEL